MQKVLLAVGCSFAGLAVAAVIAAFYPPTYITLNDSVFELFEVLRTAGVFGGLLIGLKIADLTDPKQRAARGTRGRGTPAG